MKKIELICKTGEEYETFMESTAKHCQIRLLDPRAFHYQTTEIPLTNCYISNIIINSPTQIDFDLPSNQFILAINQKSHSQVINGAVFNDSMPIFFAPDEEVTISSREHFNSLNYCFSKDTLSKYIGSSNTEIWLNSFPNLRKEPLSETFSNSIYNNLNNFFCFAASDASDNFEDSFLEHDLYTFICWLYECWECLPNKFHTNKNCIIKKAIDHIKSDPHCSSSIPDIANSCNCSVRTLELHFKKTFDCTLKNYIIKVKINNIRKALLRSSNRGRLITEILDEFNIKNKGRFSQKYYLFFGEYPKDTMQNNKNRVWINQ